MAYYTVAHLLQGGVVDGSRPGPLGVRADQLTKEVWDYIFLGASCPQTEIGKEKLDLLRREFLYWYPVDLRVSGKDLVPNHLTYFLYNHIAVWPDPPHGDPHCKWPQAVRANGHLMLNSEKMSKSTGNFLTLREAVERFSADGARLSLANAGDTLEDANFVYEMADSDLLRLYNEIIWTKNVIDSRKGFRCEVERSKFSYYDLLFESKLSRAVQLADVAYQKTLYREAVKEGFYELQNARDEYREYTLDQDGMNWHLVKQFIKVQCLLLAPVCPHVCEHVWQLMLPIFSEDDTDVPHTIMDARWPTVPPTDDLIIKKNSYFKDARKEFKSRIDKMTKLRSKGKGKQEKPRFGIIYVAEKYPYWNQVVLRKLREMYNPETNTLPAENSLILAEMKKEEELKRHMKHVMPFVQHIKSLLESQGASALEEALPYSEKEVLEWNLPYLLKFLELEEIWVESVSEASDKQLAEETVPGKPMSVFLAEPPKTAFTAQAHNCQVGSPYFSVSLTVYEGDTVERLLTRLKRVANMTGPCSVRVYRFRDPVHGPRKIPAPHPGMLDPSVMAPVMPGHETHFVVQNGDLLLKDPHYAPGCELYRVGRHFRYEVIQQSAS